MPKRKPKSGGEIPEWVVTYGDLMSLLLCFFILLAAFSELKQEREYRKAVESIKEALGFRGGMGQITSMFNPRNSQVNLLSENSSMRGDFKSESDVNETNMAGRDQAVRTLHSGQRFAVGGPVPFDAASWELTASGKESLQRVAPEIRGRNYKVMVRGHAFGTEDRAAGLDFYELSFRRARAAAEYLVRECGVERRILVIEAVGDAERVNADRHSPQAAAENRRVEVIQTEVALDELDPDPYFVGSPR